MKLADALASRKTDILDRWFQAVADTYPKETTHFLGSRSNRFANPVGHAVRQGLDGVLTSLIDGASDEETVSHLDEIIRIRAIQNFAPSEALSFVFALKGIVREVHGGGEGSADISGIEEESERLARLAFDTYMACRETLFEIKLRELREKVAIQSRNMWKEASGQDGNNILHGNDTLGGAKMKRGDDQ